MDNPYQMFTMEEIRKNRAIWQKVFKNPEGEAVMAEILNRLGYYNADPETINPNNIALCNWMFAKLGILTLPKIEQFTHAIMQGADNSDLQEDT